MTTDAPNRKPSAFNEMRKLLEDNWHRLTRRDKNEISATITAYLDKCDHKLSAADAASFNLVRPRKGNVDFKKLNAWLEAHGYMTPDGELGPRARQPAAN
jgi:hypothetical protein